MVSFWHHDVLWEAQCTQSQSPGPRFTNVFFHRNSNLMEISFHSQLNSNTVIATKFCTWHDSCAVVPCAKICYDLMASNGIMARPRFHWIKIAGKKTLMKWAPVLLGIMLSERKICPLAAYVSFNWFIFSFSNGFVPVSLKAIDISIEREKKTLIWKCHLQNAILFGPQYIEPIY